MLQQAEKLEHFVLALTGSSAYYNWEKCCTPTLFSVHLLKKHIALVQYISHRWLLSKAALSGKQNFKKGHEKGHSQVSLFACDRTSQKNYLENVKILWVGWFDEKYYFHTNSTFKKDQLLYFF